MDDIKQVALRIAQSVSKMDWREQYAVLFEAMEAVIDDEQDKPMLALIATQLFQLSEKALENSGYAVTPATKAATIN